MSAMAKMLADMVLKELPEEIREAMTPENLQRITENVQKFLGFTKGALEHLVTEQAEQRAMLEAILEKLNDNGGSGGKRNAKRVAFSDQLGTGADAGSSS